MRIFLTSLFSAFVMAACSPNTAAPLKDSTASILPDARKADAKPVPKVGAGRHITVNTPKGDFKVWTKKVGDNPDMKVLLLHGGPGMTHEIYEVFGDHFPKAGIEFYYYDQLGSYFADQPEDESLWQTARFVEEVEQVRQALNLDNRNFYIFGQSWGGILGMEYALKYQDNLKGLMISNMMASIPAYNDYAAKVMEAGIDPDVLAEIKAFEAAEDYNNPRYYELLIEHHYVDHILRIPADDWPDAINRGFEHLNPQVYVPMQGPSELGASGVLLNWDRTKDIKNITVPTLVIGAQHDTMDPAHMKWMASEIPNARYAHMPNGSHLSQYDDEANFFPAVIDFIQDVNAGEF